jgi:hypothetical protein
MPQLGEYRYVLDNVAFIYSTKEHAEQGQEWGGTGFFVAVPSHVAPEAFHHIYIVTNVHVAQNQPRTLRVNRRDGGVDLLTISAWHSIPGGADVAVAPVDLDPKRHAVEALRSDSILLTKEDVAKFEIDAGDDVFMVGRFVDHDGGQTNRPSLRFGHISMTDAAIVQNTGYAGASFVIDMHSRSGYSGSPVFVYRTTGSIFQKEQTISVGGHLVRLLGIHWGQFPENWELARLASGNAKHEEELEANLITDGQYVKGLSGMTCVVPAWDILAVLNTPNLAELRQSVESQWLKSRQGKLPGG